MVLFFMHFLTHILSLNLQLCLDLAAVLSMSPSQLSVANVQAGSVVATVLVQAADPSLAGVGNGGTEENNFGPAMPASASTVPSLALQQQIVASMKQVGLVLGR